METPKTTRGVAPTQGPPIPAASITGSISAHEDMSDFKEGSSNTIGSATRAYYQPPPSQRNGQRLSAPPSMESSRGLGRPLPQHIRWPTWSISDRGGLGRSHSRWAMPMMQNRRVFSPMGHRGDNRSLRQRRQHSHSRAQSPGRQVGDIFRQHSRSRAQSPGRARGGLSRGRSGSSSISRSMDEHEST